MTMIRAFARSRVLKGPVRADVDMAMTKWWGKQRPAEGQVSVIRFRICSAVLVALVIMTMSFPTVIADRQRNGHRVS